MKTKSDELMVMRLALMLRKPGAQQLQRLGLNAKRLHFILEKWTCRQWWDFSPYDEITGGWLTERGRASIQPVIDDMISGHRAAELRA